MAAAITSLASRRCFSLTRHDSAHDCFEFAAVVEIAPVEYLIGVKKARIPNADENGLQDSISSRSIRRTRSGGPLPAEGDVGPTRAKRGSE